MYLQNISFLENIFISRCEELLVLLNLNTPSFEGYNSLTVYQIYAILIKHKDFRINRILFNRYFVIASAPSQLCELSQSLFLK